MPVRHEALEAPNKKSKAAFFIRRIYIEKLFGRYTYDLRCKAPESEASKLLILYGDNGSGKTTILKLVFNLLSHIDNVGHKTYLAHTRFRKLAVELGKGTQVVAARRGKMLTGAFTAYVRRNRKVESQIKFNVDKDGDVVAPPDPRLRIVYNARLERFLTSLARLKIALFFLTDERELLRNVPPASERGRRSTPNPEELEKAISEQMGQRRASRLRSKVLDVALSQATAAAIEWTKEQVLSGSKQGETDANSIYAEIVKRLASISDATRKNRRTNVRQLISMLKEQAARSQDFAKFGFPSAVNIDELIRSLGSARKDLPTIYKIVEPFADTTKAKLDALQEVQNSVSSFVDTLNSFFKDKCVAFDLRTGISVRANDGTALSLPDLSSGEKQLLLLFCSTLITKDTPTVFLIDEPEISLNIKWQRHLIRSILTSTKKRMVQFVLATHSFELLAPHEENVLQLVDTTNATTRSSAATYSSRTARNS
jgi:predicted ATP-binding protein involved in virulence